MPTGNFVGLCHVLTEIIKAQAAGVETLQLTASVYTNLQPIVYCGKMWSCCDSDLVIAAKVSDCMGG